MVPLGILLGIESVREAMEHAELAPFIQDLIYHEVIPSVTEVPRGRIGSLCARRL